MRTVSALVAGLAVAPMVLAQPQPSSPPGELKAPSVREAPALPPRPAGVLEGLTPPAQSLQSAPRLRKDPNTMQMSDTALFLRNATPNTAWISIYNGEVPLGGACLQPTVETMLTVPRGAKVRVESTKGNVCRERIPACDTSINLQTGIKGLELRPGASGCALQPVNGGLLKGFGGHPLRVTNTSPNLWLWVTRYGPGREPISGWPRDDIAETACLKPRESRDFMIYKRNCANGPCKYYASIRGEFVQNNCAHPRPCDTLTVDMEYWFNSRGYQDWFIHYDPQGKIRDRFPLSRQMGGFIGRDCGGTFKP